MSHTHKLINHVFWAQEQCSFPDIKTTEGPRKGFWNCTEWALTKEQIHHFEDKSDTVRSLGHLGTRFNLVLTNNLFRALFS